ncbi:MAG: site-specific integrase [Acidobacteria bacterium]|nr:site-specific integrase [Acidobacteriota bacterium]
MSVYKRGEVWWYRFRWNGEEIRRPTKQGNKRVAEQMEAAHKTALAKGEVGIKPAKKAPVLIDFAEGEFFEYIQTRFSAKPSTVAYYRSGIQSLKAFPSLGKHRLDGIAAKDIHEYVERLRGMDYQTSTLNRKLEVLRRIFKLAAEWEKTSRALPKVALLPGERRRDRVLSSAEEVAYLDAARGVGDQALAEYEAAKQGIRATLRGETPLPPRDPYMVYHLALVLLDCGLRPEEAYRLRWEEVHGESLRIAHGKTANARRVVPVSNRVKVILDWRREHIGGEWAFPAPTKSGHIDQSSIKRGHKTAIAKSGVAQFVPYTFRHTRLTRWARVMDPYTLAHLAGHSDFSTTRRYVHPSWETVRAAVLKAEEEQTGHKNGHSNENSPSADLGLRMAIN